MNQFEIKDKIFYMKKGRFWKSIYCILYFYIKPLWVTRFGQKNHERVHNHNWVISATSSQATIPPRGSCSKAPHFCPTPEPLCLLFPLPGCYSLSLHVVSFLSSFRFHLKYLSKKRQSQISLSKQVFPVSPSRSTVFISFLAFPTVCNHFT